MGALKTIGVILVSIIGVCATVTITVITGLVGAFVGVVAFGAGVVAVVAMGISACFKKPISKPDK